MSGIIESASVGNVDELRRPSTMHLHVRCPECDVGLRLRPEHLGTRKKCPRCRNDVEFAREEASAGPRRSRANATGGRRKKVGIVAVVTVVLGVALAFALRPWWAHREERRIHALLDGTFESLGENEQGHEEYRHVKTEIVFVRLPGGTFEMGTSEEQAGRLVDARMRLEREEYRKLEMATEETRRRGDASSSCTASTTQPTRSRRGTPRESAPRSSRAWPMRLPATR